MADQMLFGHVSYYVPMWLSHHDEMKEEPPNKAVKNAFIELNLSWALNFLGQTPAVFLAHHSLVVTQM